MTVEVFTAQQLLQDIVELGAPTDHQGGCYYCAASVHELSEGREVLPLRGHQEDCLFVRICRALAVPVPAP